MIAIFFAPHTVIILFFEAPQALEHKVRNSYVVTRFFITHPGAGKICRKVPRNFPASGKMLRKLPRHFPDFGKVRPGLVLNFPVVGKSAPKQGKVSRLRESSAELSACISRQREILFGIHRTPKQQTEQGLLLHHTACNVVQ